MEFSYHQGQWVKSGSNVVVAKLLPAAIVVDDVELQLEEIDAWEDFKSYGLDGIYVTDQVLPKGNGLFCIHRKMTNKRERRVEVKSIFQVQTAFVPKHYLVPCVSYDGNEFGENNIPSGLTKDGIPWVYAYDRSGIPSCTLSEDEMCGMALFASARDALSLKSAASMFPANDGTMVQRIFHPVTEAPYTYSGKNTLTAPYEEYLTLLPGGQVGLEMYVFFCEPRWENYACADLLDRVVEFMPGEKMPHLTLERVWELGILYSKALTKECHGRPMQFTNYKTRLFSVQHDATITPERMEKLLRDPYYTVLGRFGNRFEIGWADQGAQHARMRMIDAARKNDQKELELCMSQLDNWVESQKENGLLYPEYQDNFKSEDERKSYPDACNMGWAMAELARSYRFLKSIGIEKPKYLQFSVKLAEFAEKHFSPEWGFGKRWDLDGNWLQTTGSVGGFMIMGLEETYRETGEERYLRLAEKACDFYYKRDLDQFKCTAGALDCDCVDKETAYPFIVVCLRLHELTGRKIYLERAQKAAYYFTSWMFHYDCLYPEASEFVKYGYYTTGGTAISAEHHAIDAWAVAVIPQFVELYHKTGDKRWLKRAQLMWCNGILGLCGEEGASYHGQVRPLGSQNEGFFQCRWTKYRPTCEERGHFNDCLASWMGAFRMNTIYVLSEEDRAYFQ